MHRLLLSLILLSTVSFAEEESPYILEADTRLGKLEIKMIGESDTEQEAVLNGKRIYQSEGMHLSIVKVFHTSNGEVVLFSENPGGSGTIDSHFFIQLRKDAAPVITQVFYSQTGEVSTMQERDTIKVDLGYDQGKRATLIYQDGKQTLHKVAPKGKQAADEDDCHDLYHQVHETYVQNRHCDDGLEDVGGMATVRMLRMLENDPRLDLKTLETLSKQSCKTRDTLEYSEFRKRICGA
ncbi:hypothetical protein JRI60_23100 [Archangium violaceum]|uniref:hypothetical protein n=1 Tax=Archangium violaceum TaxID=83451 RepID=UPI00194F3C8C|nr:hypothetical protein [Archangium violaceum]QRO01702.1 hypothetical protein JRI60_23100 [Archangium violaceum]